MAVDDMERRGIVGNAGLYYDLARCLCSAGRCREALKQVGVFHICRKRWFTTMLLSFISFPVFRLTRSAELQINHLL